MVDRKNCSRFNVQGSKFSYVATFLKLEFHYFASLALNWSHYHQRFERRKACS